MLKAAAVTLAILASCDFVAFGGQYTTTVVQVLQPGYRAGDRVLRAARVAVADPH